MDHKLECKSLDNKTSRKKTEKHHCNLGVGKNFINSI